MNDQGLFNKGFYLLMTLRAIILGCPGAGKGTQTKSILKHYPEIKAASSGDLLRKEIYLKTQIGQSIQASMSKGNLVSSDIIIPLIFKNIDLNSSFILDGFPRTILQAKYLDKYLETIQKPLNIVINLDVPHNSFFN